MKQRKGLLIFGGIVAALVLTCGIYLFAGTQRTESLMWNHLTERAHRGGYSKPGCKTLFPQCDLAW